MKQLTYAIAACLIFQPAESQQQRSIVREYTKTFLTYPFSDPDPIGKAGPIYPYYRFDGYTDQPVNKDWKVVELENEFIKVWILPEIGGKIWAAWEKSTGRPFIYFNGVVKFRDVAMRGAWTSGGIEANYGIIGHTPNCATPVDYLTEEKEDGSASCYIGTLDLLTETYWTIEINLQADKAYFTTRSFWHNSTPIEQPYYTWMNAGIKATGNLEFVYPGNRYLGHGGEYADWKINEENGRDISRYERNDFGGYKSYHVFGQYTNFFGAYWHDDNFGMGRYALHDEKAGKKIWIWGLSQQGMIWEHLLTDAEGQYVEVQSGRLFNQSADESTLTPFKHYGFAPGTSDSWTEYWFPVKNTKGFVAASPRGALNVRSGTSFLKLDFCPLQDLNEEMRVMEDSSLIYSKVLKLKTLQIFSDSIAFRGDPHNLRVTIGTHGLEYSSNPDFSRLRRPVDAPADFDWNSLYGRYLKGKEAIRERYYAVAEQDLRSCLDLDPHYLPALVDLSMLAYRNGAYQRSLEFALSALRIDTYDPGANFYYGLSNEMLGNTIDAKDGFDIATLSMAYRSTAYLQLSRLYLKNADYPRAMHYANKSLESNTGNVEAWQIIAVIHRLTSQQEKAKDALNQLRSLNPLNHFIRFEEYRWQPSGSSRNRFTSLIRNEMPRESYLQLAAWYHTLGLSNESLEVLKCGPPDPIICYWMAYLMDGLKDGNPDALIEKANHMSTELIFPFRPFSQEVLKWVTSRSDAWQPKYYLALIYWSKNDDNSARTWMQRCGDVNFAPLYASLASLTDGSDQLQYLRKASGIDPGQWRYGKLLVDYYIQLHSYKEALKTAGEYHTRFPRDFRISMLLARAMLLNERYKDCSTLLAETNILPYEGATDGRQLYREAWLMQAVQAIGSRQFKSALALIARAGMWPANLGVGKPYDDDIDSRLENYMEGICYERMRQFDKAREKWMAVVTAKKTYNDARNLVAALAYRKLDRTAEGEQLLRDWVEQDPQNPVAQWCTQAYNEATPAAIDGDDNYRIIRSLPETGN